MVDVDFQAVHPSIVPVEHPSQVDAPRYRLQGIAAVTLELPPIDRWS
jgi:hypothetical protein